MKSCSWNGNFCESGNIRSFRAFTSFGFDIRSGEDKGFGKLQLQYLDNNDCDSIIYFAPDTGTFNTSAEVYKLQRTNFNYNGDVNPGFLMTSCSVATWQAQNGLRRVKRENCMLQHSATNRIRFVFLGYPFEYRMENAKWLTLRRPILFIPQKEFIDKILFYKGNIIY